MQSNIKYCSFCGWYDGPEGEKEYDDAKKAYLSELNNHVKNDPITVESIDNNIQIIHMLTDRDLKTIDDSYMEYVENDLFGQKLIKMYHVYTLQKTRLGIEFIVAFKTVNSDSIYYSVVKIWNDSGILLKLPYFSLNRDSEMALISYNSVDYIEGLSDYLLNEMQFNYSGRLYLYRLLMENKIKKPHFFITLK
jgi:hypothetical protein